MKERISHWLKRTPRQNRRAVYSFLLLTFVLGITTHRAIRWVVTDYQNGIRFVSMVEHNVVAATPRGAEPAGEIWIRRDLLPWSVQLKIVSQKNAFRIFTENTEILGILQDAIGKPVYLQSVTWVRSSPGILLSISRGESMDLVIVESRLPNPDSKLGDRATVIPLQHIGIIYVYQTKQA